MGTNHLLLWEYEWLLLLLFDPPLISPTKCEWYEGFESYLSSRSPLITLWKGRRIQRGQNKFAQSEKTEETSQEGSPQHNPVLVWWVLFPMSFDPTRYLRSDQPAASSWWRLLPLGLWYLDTLQYLCQPVHGCCGWRWQAFPYMKVMNCWQVHLYSARRYVIKCKLQTCIINVLKQGLGVLTVCDTFANICWFLHCKNWSVHGTLTTV